MSEDIFTDMPQLQTLGLRNNQISILAESALRGSLSQLEYLQLEGTSDILGLNYFKSIAILVFDFFNKQSYEIITCIICNRNLLVVIVLEEIRPVKLVMCRYNI